MTLPLADLPKQQLAMRGLHKEAPVIDISARYVCLALGPRCPSLSDRCPAYEVNPLAAEAAVGNNLVLNAVSLMPF